MSSSRKLQRRAIREVKGRLGNRSPGIMLTDPSLSAAWRPAGVEPKGSLLGKHIMVTTDPETTTLEELRVHLSQFNLTLMLRRIGELSTLLEGKSGTSLEGVAVAMYCLPYLALIAIEVSSDDVAVEPDRRQLFLHSGDNYSCRVGAGGWNATATTGRFWWLG